MFLEITIIVINKVGRLKEIIYRSPTLQQAILHSYLNNFLELTPQVPTIPLEDSYMFM